MIRVGFVVASHSFRGWLGGSNYFRSLLQAISSLPDRKIEPVFVTGQRFTPEVLQDVPGLEVLRTPLVDRMSPAWLTRKISQRLGLRDILLEKFLTKHDIRVLSHSGYIGRRSRIPAICWIPDFQYKHLPQLFTPEDLATKDKANRRICREAACIIVSSRSAQEDLVAHYKGSAVTNSRILQFMADLGNVESFPPLEELRARYGFSGRYFFVPNQFWAHKNHGVIVKALSILKSQGHCVQILATGSTKDHRQPDYFDSLSNALTEAGVSDAFRILGVVPYKDLAGLMRHSVGVINPSLFEGWSTSVEEAKSMGKTVLLSSIPVHLEQEPARGRYFAPDDAPMLASMLWQAWSDYDPDTDEQQVAEALSQIGLRRRTFARKYEEIVLELDSNYSGMTV